MGCPRNSSICNLLGVPLLVSHGGIGSMIRMIGRCSQVPVVEVVGALRLLRSWLFEPDGVGFLRGIWSYIA
jgi:hypothetical protein